MKNKRRSPATEIIICLAVIGMMGLAFVAGLLSVRNIGATQTKEVRAPAGPSMLFKNRQLFRLSPSLHQRELQF
jgi:hypothetical protein